ncbi:lipase [Vibrio tubiashii]|uniref:lipase family protein n=1 Tax=Vibrio tubiashii TaxID=29498 RepID=UPI00234E99C1|nr:lipase [Vibrio tubiashii]WCP68705.1 lipase [Vibrio tubiashii]
MKALKRYQYERYAVLCNLAYQPALRQTQYGFSARGQRVICNRFGQPMIRVLWHEDKEEAIVVIKGSHNPYDWLLNLALWRRSGQQLDLPYSIHAGYYFLLRQESLPNRNDESLGTSVIDKLFTTLDKLVSDGKRITFTGHSSGGALGCVLADKLERQSPKSVKRVVTFGQPAIGGSQFSRHYLLCHKTYRICCDLDIVTFLPPIPVIYSHVGKMLWLYNGKIHENTPTWRRLSLSIISWIMRPFSYHLMSKYIRNKDFFDER